MERGRPAGARRLRVIRLWTSSFSAWAILRAPRRRALHQLDDPDIPIAGTTRSRGAGGELRRQRLSHARVRRRGAGADAGRGPAPRHPRHPVDPARRAWRSRRSTCTAPISMRRRTSSGSAISRPSASMAISAAPGSTRMPPTRPVNFRSQAARRGRAGLARLCRTSAACRCSSSGWPASTGRAAPPSTSCARARRGASSSRARCSTASMSPISAASPRCAAHEKLAGTFNLADNEPAPPQDLVDLCGRKDGRHAAARGAVRRPRR